MRASEIVTEIGFGQKWGVMARVTGGVTGTREAWLKQDGERMEFDSEDEAKQVALQRSEDANSGITATRFHYFSSPILNLREDEKECETCADLGYIPTTGQVCPDCGDGEENELMAARSPRPVAQKRIKSHRLKY